MTAFLACALLAATATGVGHLLCAVAGRSAPRLDFATAALLGAFALCALLPNAFQLGLPRTLLLGGALVAGAAGWARALQRRPLELADRRSLGAACLFLLALQAPLLFAFTLPPLSCDAVLSWWPKVAEITADSRPDVTVNGRLDLQPLYPRGMAWLVHVAWPWGRPPAAVARATPLLLTWLTALVIYGEVRRLGRPRAAIGLGLAYVLLPDVAQNANSGLAEPGIAAAVLLAALGLRLRLQHPLGHVVAITAGAGAASIKEEGTLVLAAVLASFAVDVWRGAPRRRPALTAGIAGAIALLPFTLWRAHMVPQNRLDTLGILLAAPDMLLLRATSVVESILMALFGPAALRLPLEESLQMPPCWSGWLVLGSFAVLIPRQGPRPLPTHPATILLVGAIAVYIASSADVRWHVRTTWPRMMLEVMPLLLLAATARLLAPKSSRSP